MISTELHDETVKELVGRIALRFYPALMPRFETIWPIIRAKPLRAENGPLVCDSEEPTLLAARGKGKNEGIGKLYSTSKAFDYILQVLASNRFDDISEVDCQAVVAEACKKFAIEHMRPAVLSGIVEVCFAPDNATNDDSLAGLQVPKIVKDKLAGFGVENESKQKAIWAITLNPYKWSNKELMTFFNRGNARTVNKALRDADQKMSAYRDKAEERNLYISNAELYKKSNTRFLRVRLRADLIDALGMETFRKLRKGYNWAVPVSKGLV